jgi:PAS domain S-box-containing protein
VQTKAGVWYAMRILPYRTLDNVIEGAVITFVDIHNLKVAQEALRQSQHKFASIFDKASFAAALATLPDGMIVDVNESFERIFGYARQELIGKSSQEWGLKRVQMAELLERGSITDAEIELRTKSGELRTFLNRLDVIEIENQKHALTVLEDITGRKRTEESLRESEARLAKEAAGLGMLHRLALLPVKDADFTPILGEILDAAITSSGADFGHIQLLDQKSLDLHIAVHRGFPQWWLDFWNNATQGKGARGTALETGERVMVEDVEQSPIFAGKPGLEMQLRAGVRAVQSTPLLSRSGTPLGVFSTHYKKPQRPDERELRLLDLLARQAAEMIERARMQESLRETEDRLGARRAATRHETDGALKKAPDEVKEQ